ncbi:MAG: hypothetical protein Tp1124DCM108671_37 [Prokaryotic dsDNA virus sp.]|nr:MAG: hypothetical protein Tp1125DCM102451_8 [Prokaryotic dsDNA virus sp.]QDP65594.1 MAG: hypothetical protein Tp1124DCM108671_37 [Prokaryotic dsDNA virus sp.]|tara:strand:- start:27225 stop:27596 length:372 start_codon:yes stop_codon:yes gene_type:complete
MTKERFYELKNQIEELRQEDLETSNKVAAKEKTFKVTQQVSTIKEYKHSDLPVYFKWNVEHTNWYYRARVKEGKLTADVLQENIDGIAYSFVTIDSVFNKDNIQVTKDEWRNAMHKFIKQIRD